MEEGDVPDAGAGAYNSGHCIEVGEGGGCGLETCGSLKSPGREREGRSGRHSNPPQTNMGDSFPEE